jgi:hypothetical protein
MSTLEAALRGGAIAILLFTVGLHAHDLLTIRLSRYSALLRLCAAAFVVESAPGFEAIEPHWRIPIHVVIAARRLRSGSSCRSVPNFEAQFEPLSGHSHLRPNRAGNLLASGSRDKLLDRAAPSLGHKKHWRLRVSVLPARPRKLDITELLFGES